MITEILLEKMINGVERLQNMVLGRINKSDMGEMIPNFQFALSPELVMVGDLVEKPFEISNDATLSDRILRDAISRGTVYRLYFQSENLSEVVAKAQEIGYKPEFILQTSDSGDNGHLRLSRMAEYGMSQAFARIALEKEISYYKFRLYVPRTVKISQSPAVHKNPVQLDIPFSNDVGDKTVTESTDLLQILKLAGDMGYKPIAIIQTPYSGRQGHVLLQDASEKLAMIKSERFGEHIVYKFYMPRTTIN